MTERNRRSANALSMIMLDIDHLKCINDTMATLRVTRS